MIEPEILEDDTAADEISASLQRWNERQVGPRNTHRFALSIRGEGGELLGGVVGETLWTFLFVADLWVTDEYRGRGLGRALLARAEQVAVQRGCGVAFLSTMTFQAPVFYEKCGYTAFGTLPYAPDNFGRIWFAKRIT